MTIRRLLNLWVLFGLSVTKGAQPARTDKAKPGPTRFYAVSSTFWDNGPMWDYRILEAKQDGTDTVVRDILIISVQSPCGPTCAVKAKTKRLQNTTPAELVGDNNPCAVDQRDLLQEIRRTKRALKHMPLFTTADFGIVATCGSGVTVLRLPMRPFPFKSQGPPRILRSYDLLRDVETRVFGTPELFKSAADMKLFEDVSGQKGAEDDEKAGEALVPELRSGAFDRALWEDCKKPKCAEEGLKKVLKTYIPRDQRPEPTVSWVNRPDYELLNSELPTYPPLARMARIEGDVELEIQVDESTGLVAGVAATSGHPLLQHAALQAAKGWRFQPEEHPEGVKKSRAKLRFQMNCRETPSQTGAR